MKAGATVGIGGGMPSPYHNPMCDGDKCNSFTPTEVRVLPLSRNADSGNLILCVACFAHEIEWRKGRNRDLADDCKFSLPDWTSLKVYGGDS